MAPPPNELAERADAIAPAGAAAAMLAVVFLLADAGGAAATALNVAFASGACAFGMIILLPRNKAVLALASLLAAVSWCGILAAGVQALRA